MKRLAFLGLILILVIGLFIGLSSPFQPMLDRTGHLSLMMLIITVGLWIFKPFGLSFGASSGLLMAGLLAFGVPASAVFSGFSGGAIWTLIPALFFGYALAKTGLGRRIASFGMKIVPITYLGLVIMWAIIGIVLSLLTPSITVRVVIVTPIALQSVEILGLPKDSKGRSLILLVAWGMAMIPGIGWQTGSLAGPIISGFYATNPALGMIDFASWARVTLLPVIIVTLLTLIGGYLLLKPKDKLEVSREVFDKEYQKLGPMSRQELITALVLTFSFMMFTTSKIHGIPDGATVLFAWFILNVTQIIEPKDISSGISWDLVIFIGTAMGFGPVMSQTGISDWLASHLVGAIAPITANPWIFVYAILIVFFLWRFVDIATFIPTFAIITAIVPEVSRQYGIDPLLWVPLMALAQNAFFLSYTNMFTLVAEANLGDKGWKPKELSLFGVVYFVAVLLAMVVAIPYWQSLGLFG